MVDGPIEPISAEKGFGGVPKDTTDYFDPLDFARPSFEAAKERFMDAGKIDVDPEDPALFTAFKRSMDYLADTGMAGLELSDAAFKVAVGTIAELVPGQSQEQEKRLERDLYFMPEAFMGVSPGRIQQATDTVAEGVKEVGERLNRPSQAPRSMDTMGMFIGRAANVDLDKLPESVGKDGKPRWEISDAASEGVYLEPYNTHFKKSKEDIVKEINDDIDDYGKFQGSTLENVLTHPELYDAYPSLADIPVVVDESLSEFVYGYVPGGNSPKFVAVNKKLLSDPQKFKNTLLHEVQHLVQDTEGFSPGTSVMSLSVLNKSPEVKKELDVEAIKDYEKNIADFKKNQARRLKDRTPLNTAIKLVDILQEARENKLGNDWSLGWNIDRLLEAEQEAKSFLDSTDISSVKIYGDEIRTPLDELELKIQFAIKDFSDESEEFQDLIKEAIGVSPSEFKKYFDKSWTTTADLPNPLIENKLIREAPLKKPRQPSGFTSSLTVSDETYKRSAGETEARNTGQGRPELTLEQRKQTPPESTEDRPRESQWLVEDYNNFAQGGLAVEEQMNRLYQEGGLADDGTDIEPVTGNEVPTGSMDQEVRDNIDAELEEGSYVVPADVARYYGRKFFEDLIKSAK